MRRIKPQIHIWTRVTMSFTGTNQFENSNDLIYDTPFPIEVSFATVYEKRDNNEQAEQ